MNSTIKFAIIDDHKLFSDALESLIKKNYIKSFIISFRDARKYLNHYSKEIFDVILLDLSLPGINGFECLKAIKRENKNQKVIIITAFTDILTVQKCIQLGCSSLISKADEVEDIITAIDNVLKNGSYQSKWILDAISETYTQDLMTDLSENELKFLELICSDYTYESIAEVMNLSIKTIDGYRSKLCDKLNVKSRSSLVKFAIRHIFWERQRWIV